MAPTSTPLLRQPLVILAIALAALWALGALVASLAPILSPFLIGAIFAYIGNPLVEKLTRLRLSRTTGSALVILGALALVALLVGVLLPLVKHELTLLAERVPGILKLLDEKLAPWLSTNFGINLEFDAAALRELLTTHGDTAQTVAQRVLPLIGSGGAAVLSLLGTLLIAPVVMFYLLRDWNTLLATIDRLIPRAAQPRVEGFAARIDRVLAEFLRGQLGVMTLLAIFYSLALALAGVDFALAIGLITGALIFIPYVGFSCGLALALLVSLQQGFPVWAWVLAIFGVGQVLESFILTPRLIGERIGLHPLAVIFALMAFAQLFGFVGVLIALPASAVLLVALRECRVAYLKSAFYGDNLG